MKFKFIMISLVCLSMSGCGHTSVSIPFDNTQKVQSIEVFPNEFIFAQNDKVLDSSLKKELSTMNLDWKKQLNTSQNYQTAYEATILAQALSFVGCLVADSGSDFKTASCGAAFGLMWLPYFFRKKSLKIKHKVIQEYNSQYEN